MGSSAFGIALGGAVAGVAVWLVARQLVFRRRRPQFRIRELPGFLSPEECDELVALATPLLETSKVVTKGGRRLHPARVARSAVLDNTGERVVRKVKERMARACDVSVDHLENLQVTWYGPFGHYMPHADSLVENGIECGLAGDRTCAMIVYLNEGCTGGRTRFLQVGRSVRPVKGKAIIFPTVDAEGHPHPYARHAGMPVLRGEKWIINQLVRTRPFRAATALNRSARRKRAAQER